MNQKIVPLVAIAAGILAFSLTYKYLQDKEREIERTKAELFKGARMISVVGARVDIPGQTRIKVDDLDLVHIPEATAPEQVILKEDGAKILGRKTLLKIGAGRAILWNDIEGSDKIARGLSTLIKPKLRAVSIAVSGAAAVSGMVEPNDHVDVLGTFSFPSKAAPDQMETVTMTVLQDVSVLATGQELPTSFAGRRVPGRSTSYSTVTLEVTPREAELLVFAQQTQGRLTLALRNGEDVHYEPTIPEIDFKALESEVPTLNQERQRTIRLKGNP
jgi:pilus assembly protein CpaB